MTDDPFLAVWRLCQLSKTKGYKYLSSVPRVPDHLQDDNNDLMRKNGMRLSDCTKCITYVNPGLWVYNLSSGRHLFIWRPPFIYLATAT